MPLDLPATAGSAAVTLLGVALGLALAWLLFRVAQRDRTVGLALLLLAAAVFSRRWVWPERSRRCWRCPTRQRQVLTGRG